jgi:hypothetical protein
MTFAIALALGSATLVGCSSAPPWLDGETAAPATSAPATTLAPVPIQNDLAAGSMTRTVPVGAATLTIDYWSTLTMDKWTANATKPLSFSIKGTVTPNDGQKLYLSRVTLEAVVRDAQGDPLPGFASISDQGTVAPGYLILDPYSYSQTFTLPPLDERAAALEITMRYELLQQATPTSGDYSKQTANDLITIAIAQDPSTADDPTEDAESTEAPAE